jgi:hypothetical protein
MPNLAVPYRNVEMRGRLTMTHKLTVMKKVAGVVFRRDIYVDYILFFIQFVTLL